MPQYITDPDLLRQLGAGSNPFDSALKAEGASGKIAEIARSIYQQESGGGRNTKTSNAGAVGGMQIIPDTFRSVADKDWKIDDPEQNARAGIRYIKQLYEQAGGDPALTAAGYYGGPGGLEKARRGIAVSDPRNPNAPNTLQYGQQVASRLPKERGLVQRAVEGMVPSAQAAEAPARQYIQDPEILAQLEGGGGEEKGGAAFGVYPSSRRAAGNNSKNATDAIVMGGARGVRDVIDTGAEWLSRIGGADEAARVKAGNDQSKADFKKEYGDSALASVGRIGGNIAATLPVGGVLAEPVRAVVPFASKVAPAVGNALAKLSGAIASSGANTGAVQGGNALANLAIRSTGGAITGGASAALIDPESAGLGAAVGGALPPVAAALGAGSRAVGGAVRPFTEKGQEQIVAQAMRRAATDPVAARQALAASREMIPGSVPTVAAAAGDTGLAALSRSMEIANPEYAANFSARQTAQNQARTAAIEDIAGNTGKIAIAKDARKALTDPMREEVLNAAGKVPSESILKSLDRLIAKPDNAGELSQQALNKFRTRIEQFSQDGAIDARALYEIRKDINTTLGGKLQGDAGNLKYASGQLTSVKGLIDDAIDQASRRVASPGPLSASREVVPFQASTELAAPGGRAIGPAGAVPAAEAAGGARPTWRGYLEAYTKESIPIGQMEKLDEILASVQTGTADSQGSMVISAAKLNNLMKNQRDEIAKELSPKQLQLLRNLQADLNAQQIAANTGKAGRSDTAQNLAQNELLRSALGEKFGNSTGARTTLGKIAQWPYSIANQNIQSRLGNALLDPQAAAKLLSEPQTNALLKALEQARPLAYRAAPALTAR